MSEQPTFRTPAPTQGEETTGRHVITFRDDAVAEGLAALQKEAGIARLPSAADFTESAVDIAQVDAAGGVIFPALGVAVVTLADDKLNTVLAVKGEDAAILDVEPERIFHALGDGTLPLSYLHGYRDAVNHLYEKTAGETSVGEATAEAAVTYVDDAVSTWGLKATCVMNSRYTGRGIKVAILDTGLDLQHPDFRGRAITAKSFYPGETPQDRIGHGTHTTGTACGFKDASGRRYGVACESAIFVGKVLGGPFGSGSTAGVLAGIEWAITSGCQLISMSLGADVNAPSPAYEAVGRRALAAGCLIVAAASNNANRSAGNFGFVGQPANSPSIMAVAAIDSQLQIANFSPRSGGFPGSAVDIAAPGVRVYSSVPVPKRYDIYSGTSMATPHVSGIGALWAQANRARGWQLWQLLISHARRLTIPAADVGTGLVQAPK
jgi:subtilisin family serine protease